MEEMEEMGGEMHLYKVIVDGVCVYDDSFYNEAVKAYEQVCSYKTKKLIDECYGESYDELIWVDVDLQAKKTNNGGVWNEYAC